ncbi:MAG: hypothetical protein BGN96_04570 [Bacteroidales bacterium 45-6]|nr:MAG: hypothetical protein BGN96_04570 [Bacteroidales bacterium 45-6]
MIKPEDIYARTNNGLDIIFDFYPQAKEVYGQNNKAFKLRASDHTASSFLREVKGVWKVIDFGDEGRAVSPIDICMREKGLKFNEAIYFLAAQYDVTGEVISPEKNKPDIRQSPATEEEPDGYFYYEANDKISDKDLLLLGPNVKQEHCDLLGYESIKFYKLTKKRQTTTVYATENYPMFIRTCKYKDEKKNEKFFYKIYQPLNADKAFRFFYKGEKPQHYINGLYELQKMYKKFNDDEEKRFRSEPGNEDKDFKLQKFPEAFLCSGERDALCVKAFNYFPLWFNSETYNFEQFEYKEVMRYVERLYNIPDIDDTGLVRGGMLALKYIDIYTLWLPKVLRNYRDNRLRPRKDFRDYCEIWPEKYRFKELLNLAMPACFWETIQDKRGQRLEINSDYVSYFLKLNGFVSLEDKNSKTGRMLARIQGNVVEEVKIKEVRKFLKLFVRERFMPVDIRNLVNNSTRLTEANIELEEVELSFEDYTPDSQLFFFRNAIWKVTGSGIEEFKLGTIDKYVWKEELMDHQVKRLSPCFMVKQILKDEGLETESKTWDIQIAENGSNFFRYLINASRIFWRKEYEVPGEQPELLEEYRSKYKFAIDGPRLDAEEIQEQKMHLLNKLFCIGYLLHRYKAENRAWCVFAMDNKIAENSDSNGGSGKSFCFKAPRLFMKTVTLPGRNSKMTENSHIYERVTEHVDYILIDDADAFLDFGFFFDSVTGEINVNPKFSQSYEIPFEKAPKYCITSNYTLRRFDPSTERRILYAVFSDYYHQKTAENDYHETRTIYDDFGKQLFRENYTDAEWNADINFFMDCIQFYMSVISRGEKIQPPMNNVVDRNLRTEMTDIFFNWAEVYFSPGSPNCDKCVPRTLAMTDFEKETRQTKWTTQKFTQALKAYCRYADHIIELNPRELMNSQGRIIRRHESKPGSPVEMIYVRTKEALNYVDVQEDGKHDNNSSPTTKEDLPF